MLRLSFARIWKALQQIAEFLPGTPCVLTNFSPLRPAGDVVRIERTEDRGISVPQLLLLLDFVRGHVGHWCETSNMSETFSVGQQLTLEGFNLYHACSWVIQPSTRGFNDGNGCSFVELLASEATKQKPSWFVSHAWKEPVWSFVNVLQRHKTVRQLNTYYWVCAYANNQHCVGEEIPENPRKSSFYLALKSCDGIILVLDTNASAFGRIWCCFEESIAIEEQQMSDQTPLLLDVGATAFGQTHLITDGLAGQEIDMVPVLAWHSKTQREASFPTEILRHGLFVNICNASATRPEDKSRILGSIALPRQDTALLSFVESERYQEVNQGLASHFAIASWYGHLVQRQPVQDVMAALAADRFRRIVQLSFAGLQHFSGQHLEDLMSHLPRGVQALHLDVSFTELKSLQALRHLEGLALQSFEFRCVASPLCRAESLALLAGQRTLRALQLWLVSLPGLNIGHLGWALEQLHNLEDLVISVNHCNLVTEQKVELWQGAQRLKRQRGAKLESWLSIEDCQELWWSQWLECCGLNVVSSAHAHAPNQYELASEFSSAESSTSASSTVLGRPEESASGYSSDSTSEDQEASRELPYPCSYPGCKRFHDNWNGYCPQHPWSRWVKCTDVLKTAWHLSQLMLLFMTQAAMELDSRGLLALLLLSLFPVACYSIQQEIGMMVITFVVMAGAILASTAYTVYKFDRMRRLAREIELQVEASYAEALKTAVVGRGRVFSIFGELRRADPPSAANLDLRSSYLRAKHCLPNFERDFCMPLAEHMRLDPCRIKAELVQLPVAKELYDKQGTSTLPLLFCKVPCQNLQEVVAAWSLLQPRAFAVEDGFAVARGTREASVLLDLDGCVAKVIFVLAPLQHIQPDLGTVHRWADVLGLLDSPRRVSVSALHRGIGIGAVVTMLRMVSAMLSLYLAAQYFLRYGPPVELPAALGQLLVFDINSQSQIEDEDFTDFMPWWPWLHGIIYSIPYFVLAALLSYDTCRCRNASARKKPTQEVYDRYFGLRGTHYTWKVAILQCFTVCLQTLGKLKLLSSIISVAMSLQSKKLEELKIGFWCFLLLLAINALYPSILILLPDWRLARLAAASMDAVLDLGYTLTYIAIVLASLPALSSQSTVLGNFGDEDLLISNQLTPAFAFPADALGFAAVYVSLAHVLAVCRALERAAREGGLAHSDQVGKGRGERRGRRGGMPTMRTLIAGSYSSLLLLMICWNLYGASYPWQHPNDFRCFPCRCEPVANQSLRLERCDVPDILRYNQLSLSNLTITEIAPGALPKNLKVLALSGNSLKNLRGGLFAQSAKLQVLDLGRANLTSLDEEAFLGLKNVRLLSLSQNNLRQLPEELLKPVPKLEKLFLGGKTDNWGNIIVKGNLLSSLPQKLFLHSKHMKILDLSENKLQELPAHTFQDLTALEILDLRSNEISQIPRETFANLTSLQTLDLYHNKISQIPRETFANLTSLQTLNLRYNWISQIPREAFANLTSLQTLDLLGNKISQIPREAFASLTSLQTLDLYHNEISQISPESFASLTSLQTLDLHHNMISQIPQEAFASLTFLEYLDLSGNKISQTSGEAFASLTSLQTLDLGGNEISQISPEAFATSHLCRSWTCEATRFHRFLIINLQVL